MADLYNKAQWIFVAGANKSGSIYGIVPVPGTSNVTLASSSTFRSTSGSRTNSSGIIENIAPHILRVDYPFQDTCPSYKFEPQRTNYLFNTDHLATGSSGPPNEWSLLQASWSLVSDPTSPVGTGLAGFIRENTANSSHYIRNVYSIVNTSGSSFTISVYAKQSDSVSNPRHLMISPAAVPTSAGATYFILSGTGSIFSPSVKTYVSGAFIEPLPNGWYRCSVLAGYPSGSSPDVRFLITSGSTYTDSYVGNDTSGLYLVGAQLESGSAHSNRTSANISITNGTYVTSYISSSTTTLGTRAADRSISLPAPVGTTDWTAFIAYTRLSPDLVATNFDIKINSGSSAFVGLYNNGVAIYDSGSGGTLVSGSSLSIGVEHKYAIRLSGSQMTWFIDGSKKYVKTWGTTGTWTATYIGDQGANNDITHKSSMYVRVAAMFSQSLSDAECISLTTTGSGTSIV